MQIFKIGAHGFPPALSRIPAPPKRLFVRGCGIARIHEQPSLAIVGSRKLTAYGKAVTARFAGELARMGVIIVSGFAFGVDAAAHRSTLEAGGITIAVLACGVDYTYPAAHHQLGEAIIEHGGAIVSEYSPRTTPYKEHFIARNRLVSGLADGVLVTEAALKSGSLHTARFALEQGKEVLAVPGNITSETSVGTNNLIRHGATPVTTVEDIIHAMGWERLASMPTSQPIGDTTEEQRLLDLVQQGIAEGERLLEQSRLPVQVFQQTLTMLEITGKLRALGNNRWTIL